VAAWIQGLTLTVGAVGLLLTAVGQLKVPENLKSGVATTLFSLGMVEHLTPTTLSGQKVSVNNRLGPIDATAEIVIPNDMDLVSIDLDRTLSCNVSWAELSKPSIDQFGAVHYSRSAHADGCGNGDSGSTFGLVAKVLPKYQMFGITNTGKIAFSIVVALGLLSMIGAPFLVRRAPQSR
jgi:hypothetical protein